MDTAKYLRTHTTVVFNRPRGLVSPGAAWRYRKKRELDAKARKREREIRREWANNPDNPSLTATRRAELLAAANPDAGPEFPVSY